MSPAATSTAAPAASSTNPVKKVFVGIGHFFGKVALAAVSIVHKVKTEDDAIEPVIVKVLDEGASVATLIPGVGPEVASLLNAGVQLLGDAKASIDATDAVLAQAEQQAQALAPEGYTFVAIKADVKADLATLLAQYKQAFDAAKSTVSTLHPPASPTVPSPAAQAAQASGGAAA